MELGCKVEVYRNVPFGNSVFQIENFTAGKESPQRRYRHCLLQLNQKYNTLKECEFRHKRYDVDINELKNKLKKVQGFEKQRIEIDLEEKEHHLNIELKLIEDCLFEVAAYKRVLKTLPEYTRQEFEEAEQGYWKNRLLGDARREMISTGSVGIQTIESLENIGMNIGRNKTGQITYSDNNSSVPICEPDTQKAICDKPRKKE